MKLPKFRDYVDQHIKYVQIKKDGHLAYITIDHTSHIMALSKNGKDITKKVLACTHLLLQLTKLPAGTELMAELHCPGIPATSVPTMLNAADERLQLSIFACPTLGNVDKCDIPLNLIMDQITQLGLDAVPVVYCRRICSPLSAGEKKLWLQKAIDNKIEGYVLKESHTKGWYKLKPVKTIDAFIIDVTESDSATYKGHIKAVRLGLMTDDLGDDGKPIFHDLGMCGGFEKDFKLSKSYDEMKRYLMGKVLPIEYREITPHRKLKWPNVINDDNGLVIRTDKDSDQCTVAQLNG